MTANSLVADSAERLFGEGVDKHVLDLAEAGTWPADLWRLVQGNGFPDTLVPQASGGFGGDWNDAYQVLRSAGAHSLPLPLAETIIGRSLLAHAGLEIPEGPLAIVEQARCATLRVSAVGGSVRLDGVAPELPWGRQCRWAVVSALLDDAPLLLLVALTDQPTVTVTTHQNIAGEPRDAIAFSGALCSARAFFVPACPQPVWVLGALARSIASVGALEAALALSIRYAGEREQFGKPIARYQAIQHTLAVMAGEVSSARMAAQTAAAGAAGPTTLFDVAVAKVRSAEAAGRVAALGHQVHGAMGITHEYALNFLTRRLWSWRREFGTDAQWAGQLGAAAIAAGGSGFWPRLTDRSLLG